MASPLETLWTRLAGPADQGRIDFARLERRKVPNDALAASPGAVSATVDRALPVYAEPPEALLRRLDVRLADDRNVERVDDRASPTYRRYVVRTALLRFPDTVDVEAGPDASGHTLLRLYARSQLGKGDFGANAKRLAAWTEGLSTT
ncbi:DUF1499 domain-containing protein [Aurantimonas aggregata]|uniref:DUF1499 domain-containing protein n=1 Tax=Aurantimonas aggregata TaxID=2047720 RepID=A0A6L9MCR7_9HYPH|nr:DUF1499 domain-containing protein [Aurantimonas aggregata]NDV85589.1 DUF1499 domain-containing protein [Aurantimonas aggregata]